MVMIHKIGSLRAVSDWQATILVDRETTSAVHVDVVMLCEVIDQKQISR